MRPPIPKRPKPIKDKKHSKFLHELVCLCCGAVELVTIYCAVQAATVNTGPATNTPFRSVGATMMNYTSGRVQKTAFLRGMAWTCSPFLMRYGKILAIMKSV